MLLNGAKNISQKGLEKGEIQSFMSNKLGP